MGKPVITVKDTQLSDFVLGWSRTDAIIHAPAKERLFNSVHLGE